MASFSNNIYFCFSIIAKSIRLGETTQWKVSTELRFGRSSSVSVETRFSLFLFPLCTLGISAHFTILCFIETRNWKISETSVGVDASNMPQTRTLQKGKKSLPRNHLPSRSPINAPRAKRPMQPFLKNQLPRLYHLVDDACNCHSRKRMPNQILKLSREK